jgi:hypothetical protein
MHMRPNRVSTAVDFRNSVAVGISSELVYTSAGFHGIPCAKLRGIPDEIPVLHRNYFKKSFSSYFVHRVGYCYLLFHGSCPMSGV